LHQAKHDDRKQFHENIQAIKQFKQAEKEGKATALVVNPRWRSTRVASGLRERFLYRIAVETDDYLVINLDYGYARLLAFLDHSHCGLLVLRNIDFLEFNSILLEVLLCQLAVNASWSGVDSDSVLCHLIYPFKVLIKVLGAQHLNCFRRPI